MTAASFRLKYAIASFLVVLLAAGAVAILFMVRHAADARSLSALAEHAARERLDPELEARARSVAAHGADAIAGAVRAGDTDGIARRLQPFTDDTTVAAITLTGSSGRTLYSWHREGAAAPGRLTAQASAKVRTFAENIPGAATPETHGTLTVTLEQAAPVPGVSLAARVEQATAQRARLTWWLALAVGASGAPHQRRGDQRAVSHLQRPLDSLIRCTSTGRV